MDMGVIADELTGFMILHFALWGIATHCLAVFAMTLEKGTMHSVRQDDVVGLF